MTYRTYLFPFLAAVCAVAVGAAVGALVAVTAVGSTQSTPDVDAWARLGAFLLGIFVGVATGVGVWIVGLVVAARKVVPRGRRVGAVLVSVGLGLGVLVLLPFAFQTLVGSVELPYVAVGVVLLLGLLFLCSGSVGFWLWLRRDSQRHGRGQMSV